MTIDHELVKACQKENIDEVKLIINNGANINAEFNYPIQYSAQNGHLEIVQYLIEKGVDIPYHAFINSARNGHFEVVKCLVEKGSDKHLALALDEALRQSAKEGYLEIVKFLVEEGTDIHAKDNFPLRYSARNGHLKVFKYLVEKGADIHSCNDEALMYSAMNGHLEIAKYLFHNGADVNTINLEMWPELYEYVNENLILQLYWATILV